MDERKKSLPPNIILAMMALAAVAVLRALLPVEGPPDSDFAYFLYPWMNVIRHEGLASIAGGFSEYTPPYIYLLNVAAVIEPVVGTMAAIKLTNLPFVISCAWGVGALVNEVSGDRDLGKIAAAVTLVCPSLLINAFAHGQCDAIFTSFLIWFVYFAMRDRPVLACLMFGLAFSFKLQAIFVAPLLLALLLWRRIKLWHLLIIPATYVAMMIPAALAGRPWGRLLTIYLRQGDLMQDLSLNAPNPWWFLRGVVDYKVGMIVGTAVGAAAVALLAWRSVKLSRTSFSILLLAATSAALLPWVLPKMTARYFFIADLLTIALAFVRPRLWPAAVLIQIGSLIAVFAYFSHWASAAFAVGPTTFGVLLLAYELLRSHAGSVLNSQRSLS
jgi:Gpi18-like mannosyltransferase